MTEPDASPGPAVVDPGRVCEIVGEGAIRSMVTAFYRRVREDDLIGPMYPDDDWEGAERRLAGFLVYRFGGSAAYLEERGHPRLRMRHAPFPIGGPEAARWVALMDEAMDEEGIAAAARAAMRAFFVQTADFMRNRED